MAVKERELELEKALEKVAALGAPTVTPAGVSDQETRKVLSRRQPLFSPSWQCHQALSCNSCLHACMTAWKSLSCQTRFASTKAYLVPEGLHLFSPPMRTLFDLSIKPYQVLLLRKLKISDALWGCPTPSTENRTTRWSLSTQESSYRGSSKRYPSVRSWMSMNNMNHPSRFSHTPRVQQIGHPTISRKKSSLKECRSG